MKHQLVDQSPDQRRMTEAINRPEVALSWPAIVEETNIPSGAAPMGFGACIMDRSVFRTVLPDFKWYVYAAGLADPGDGNNLHIALVYIKDDTTAVVLGTGTFSGAGMAKRSIGPFDVFATAGVPPGETLPLIRVAVDKVSGTAATVDAWAIMLRLFPFRQ